MEPRLCRESAEKVRLDTFAKENEMKINDHYDISFYLCNIER